MRGTLWVFPQMRNDPEKYLSTPSAPHCVSSAHKHPTKVILKSETLHFCHLGETGMKSQLRAAGRNLRRGLRLSEIETFQGPVHGHELEV